MSIELTKTMGEEGARMVAKSVDALIKDLVRSPGGVVANVARLAEDAKVLMAAGQGVTAAAITIGGYLVFMEANGRRPSILGAIEDRHMVEEVRGTTDRFKKYSEGTPWGVTVKRVMDFHDVVVERLKPLREGNEAYADAFTRIVGEWEDGRDEGDDEDASQVLRDVTDALGLQPGQANLADHARRARVRLSNAEDRLRQYEEAWGRVRKAVQGKVRDGEEVSVAVERCMKELDTWRSQNGSVPGRKRALSAIYQALEPMLQRGESLPGAVARLVRERQELIDHLQEVPDAVKEVQLPGEDGGDTVIRALKELKGKRDAVAATVDARLADDAAAEAPTCSAGGALADLPQGPVVGFGVGEVIVLSTVNVRTPSGTFVGGYERIDPRTSGAGETSPYLERVRRQAKALAEGLLRRVEASHAAKTLAGSTIFKAPAHSATTVVWMPDEMELYAIGRLSKSVTWVPLSDGSIVVGPSVKRWPQRDVADLMEALEPCSTRGAAMVRAFLGCGDGRFIRFCADGRWQQWAADFLQEFLATAEVTS